ncbi:hydantoinase/oxoprolinase family protein [Lacticaseibacillus hegangensis]|uniref:Hydantoinase/oxoprolinase family protein n=1 Tax=Lacticaseibacillus hegangensis TaxID=2486010 RepID=A0ABW4CZT5_9LACO|nr:hydantoinase/oxoprolinase family protein [Lacticaseibacillus hegangensis]
MSNTKVRVGIDVGGTFTDAVVVDNTTHEILAKVKVPTTHHAARGVAEGIIIAINKVLDASGVDPADVVFIAHGTTQATNALLEGDVASVGIIGMGKGFEGKRANGETQVGDIELAPGKFLHTSQVFLDSTKLDADQISHAVEDLKAKGAEVIVASEAYSVDNPQNEKEVLRVANEHGMLATGGYEISQLYGLLARTRTASVNAALIPKMMETANMTESSVREAHINKPLMIMRCDGGVMNVDEVRKRPILTMLSGLAAGVAGVLMYEKITDGIFLEAGGTSVDISVVKNGKVMVKNSEVGGHKLYLTSLDVRTLGIAGGSMIVVRDKKIVDVGPRSAHIAELEYESFTETENMAGASIELIAPCSEDRPDYVAVKNMAGVSYALTLAGAANVLGYVPETDYAHGNIESSTIAWQALADYLGQSLEDTCRQAMNIATDKVMKVVQQLIDDYHLNTNLTYLVGGGGSAAVITPYLGERMKIRHRIAKNAPYISTIGVALAMVMERLERNVSNPSPDDIKKIRHDILEMVTKAGANPDTVEIAVEIDNQKNILRAVATGATELRTKNVGERARSVAELTKIVSESVAVPESSVSLMAHSGNWYAFSAQKVSRTLFGLLKKTTNMVRIIDADGVIRLQNDDALIIATDKKNIESDFLGIIDDLTVYNDGGAILPKCYLYFRQKTADLSGVLDKEQLLPLINMELEYVEDAEKIIAVAIRG